jgi:hypothetical protein
MPWDVYRLHSSLYLIMNTDLFASAARHWALLTFLNIFKRIIKYYFIQTLLLFLISWHRYFHRCLYFCKIMCLSLIAVRFSIWYRRRSLWPRGLSMNRLRPLKHWDRGFESHLRHGYLCAFILCLCCPVCRWRPYDGLIPRPRSPTDCV